jgi:hypothetical protein
MQNNDLKINVAYSEILVYNTDGSILYPNSNIANYDVYPWWSAKFDELDNQKNEYGVTFPYTLEKNDSLNHKFMSKFGFNVFESLLNNNLKNIFKAHKLDDIYNKGETFLYPIILLNNNLFNKYEPIDIDKRVIQSVKAGRAKICFIQAMEGFLFTSDVEFVWLNNLVIKYDLDKDSLIVITSNLKALDNYNELLNLNIIEDTFTIIPHSYFQHNLWFHQFKNHNQPDLESLHSIFNDCLEKNKTLDKEKHFLCFNRVPKPHRLCLFGEIKTNKKLYNKFIITIGSDTTSYTNYNFYDPVNYCINNSYKHDKNKILKFYKDYDSTKHHSYDEFDLENNKASNINIPAHKKTFVNIVTESLTDSQSIFFSEKTFKPIYCAQPFILFGNPHSLRKLKEMGFQTFDKWWDESYDDEFHFTRRLEKIVDVMEEISEWSLEKCKEVTLEMESVLINNFEVMISDENLDRLYDKLRF